jgi:hypothetical protein
MRYTVLVTHLVGKDIGPGTCVIASTCAYNGATIEQRIEVLDDAIRWSLEYDANGCDLPAWLGLHPGCARYWCWQLSRINLLKPKRCCNAIKRVYPRQLIVLLKTALG